MQVVAPLAVSRELGERVRVPEHAVDLLHQSVLVHPPQPAEQRPERPDLIELGPVTSAAARPTPLPNELVQLADRLEQIPVAALGVHERGGSVEGNFGVMGEKHVDPLRGDD